MNGSVILSGRDKDNGMGDVRVSSIYTHALATTDEKQVLKEDGKVFQASIELSIGTGVTDYVLGITPAVKRIMMTQRLVKVFAASGALNVTVELLKDVVCTTAVANITPVNANHNSDIEAEFLIHDDTAAITDEGSPIPGKMHLIASSYIAEAGGSSAGAYEMALSTKYALKIINNGAATVTVAINWEWAEVE